MDIEKTIEKIIENQDPKTIIIILLIIVLVVYNLYKLYNHYFYIDNLLSDIKVISNFETNNDDYRVADVVYRRGWPPNHDEWKQTCRNILSNKKLKDTFLYNYLTKYQPPTEPNIVPIDKRILSKTIDTIFEDIKTKYPNKFKTPKEYELVIQLRLGDFIETGDFLKKNYIQLIHEYISNYTINEITFVCAFFFGNNVTTSNEKLFFYSDEKLEKNKQVVYKLLNKIHKTFPHIKLNIYSNYGPDLDIYYLYKAKHLITDSGGFGELAQTIHDNL